ncbi:MAG: DUF4129 domain-containing protein [Chloroflexota bacterium]
MIRTALVLLACLIVGVRLSYAQPIDEAKFWLLVEQTQQTLAQPQPNLDVLRQKWAAVAAVEIDGKAVTLDLAWITDGLSSGNTAQQPQLRHYLSALLDYHAQQHNSPDGGASLAALDKVLSDARFQYAQIEPTALPTAAPDTAPQSQPASEPEQVSLFGQIAMIALGIVGVILVLSYVARSINVQGAELKAGGSDEDPTNFAEARERAENYEAARNYRAAIRYLYLSSLLLLDEHNLIRYDPSLTNREHLRQIAAKPQLFDALRQVINTFEDVWYGFQPVDDALYQAYRRHIDQLRQLIS